MRGGVQVRRSHAAVTSSGYVQRLHPAVTSSGYNQPSIRCSSAASRGHLDCADCRYGRSHALLQLSVSWVETKGKSFGILNLVDLAGSDGMKKTGATGQNAKEGIKINLSLTKLAFVVKCLAEGSSHIPFRESKLTMMLAKVTGVTGVTARATSHRI